MSGNTDALCFLPRYFGLPLRSRACFAPAWGAASSPSSFVACEGRDEDFGKGTAGCALPYGKHPQIWRGSAYKYPSPLILISARPRAGIGVKLLWAARLALCSPGRLPGKAAPAFGEPKVFVHGGGEPPGPRRRRRRRKRRKKAADQRQGGMQQDVKHPCPASAYHSYHLELPLLLLP